MLSSLFNVFLCKDEYVAYLEAQPAFSIKSFDKSLDFMWRSSSIIGRVDGCCSSTRIGLLLVGDNQQSVYT